MKVLIFESWSHTPQFETGLEIAENHISNGDQVTYVNIGGYLPFVEWYLVMDASYKQKFIYKHLFKSRMNFTKRVIHPKIKFHPDTLLSKKEIKNLFEDITFQNIDELKGFEWNNMDIGMAVASSLISVTNDLSPDVKFQYKTGVQNILHASKIVAKSFEKWLEREKPDLVYFRNGRVALYRPVMRICQQRNQKYLIHDRGCNKDHYKISPDLRHNFEMVNGEVIETWDNEKDFNIKKSIAEGYYSDRRHGKEQAWKSFVDKMKKDILPNNWDPNKHNITFYNSSISEYAAIGNINKDQPLFINQFEAIEFITSIVKKHDDICFYLRLHPNLMNQSQKEIDLWMDFLNNPYIRVIPADSKVDTYAMILNSDLNIAFLSTTAIESAYYKKPSIQLAQSWYHKLGSTYFPKTKEEFKNLILNKELQPKDNIGALMFGYYMNTFGSPYIHFKPKSLSKGKYKGVDLQRYPKSFKFMQKSFYLMHKIKNRIS